MKFTKYKWSKALSIVLAIVLTVMALPMSAFAAPASDLPANMIDHAILRALEYTGYDVQKQKNDGTLYQSGSYGNKTPASVLSNINYGTGLSGMETIADPSTVTGKAPDIARFERNGLCCASFVTYFICNYLPNIEGADTKAITDAIKVTGMNSQAVVTWETALKKIDGKGMVEKIGTSPSNVDRNKLTPGDLIIFGTEETTHTHIAVYSGTYKGTDFLIHVGNDRGPEIMPVKWMSDSSNGAKTSYPNAYYHLNPKIFQDDGSIEVYKKDTDGNNLSGAVFVATNTQTGLSYNIGPTNSNGYAKSTNPIPYGTYNVKETVFPVNCHPYGKSEWTVTVGTNNNGLVTINAVNEVDSGKVKLVKVSEDGKIDGVSFKITGKGIDKIVKTGPNGEITIENLKPGIYKVSEIVADKYEPQETHEVTVVSNKTATVTFNNTLKRGNLKVIKSSEDGFVENMRFHLSGISLSGIKVDEYAITNKDGIAEFNNVLIGSGYVLEEVDTPVKYVVPSSQTADVEWNKVTKKNIDNILKKWRADIYKVDSEISHKNDNTQYGATQGDATLKDAVYGLYHNNVLVDTYITDDNGYFLTDYYTCDGTWYLQEISPSKGYLLDDTKYYIDCSADKYTVELNTEYLNLYETIIKGKIDIIKHCDDGSTKIETPETGAEFEVFLKSACSYDNAKDTERDILICDKYGFAETKNLPYGIYTVKQIKGWEGTELLPPFEVNINTDSETYRYLINNAIFESEIEIVKQDAETGKIIPAAGIGFKVRNTDTGEYIVQRVNYPTPVDIEIYYTDSTGKLMLPYPLLYGNYEIIEQNTCYGYVLDSSPIAFKVDGANDIVTVTKYNMAQKGTITIEKTGEVFATVSENNGVYQPIYENKGLAGAVYEISAAEDIITLDGTLRYTKGQVVSRITTEKDGKGTTEPLYLGKFTVKEVAAPYGMLLNNNPVDVVLKYAGENVEITSTSTSFVNERQKAEVELFKALETDTNFNIGNCDEIKHVKFALCALEDIIAVDGKIIPANGLLEIATCDEDGKAVFATDIPVGAKLYIKEIATDNHYILSNTKYPVVFEYAGQTVSFVKIQANAGETIGNELIYGAIKGVKIDRETDKVIQGAVFGLFSIDASEFIEERAILTAETDEDGIFTFEKIPFGKWIVKELQPANGYLPNEELYPVTITENEKTIEITVVNDRIPEIATTADVEGEKEICATEIVVLTDTVSYQHLVPGKEYLLKGVLMDKTTGNPLVIDGEEMHSEILFVPETPNGVVEVTFTFDSKNIKSNTDIVVFENLFRDGKELAVHTDINDKGQTVTVKVPQIGTQAMVGEKKEVVAKGNITIDDIVHYTNLTPGKEYTICGILMNKKTGESFKVEGQEVTAEITFIPEQTNGEIKVSFNFNADGLTFETEVVVFEKLFRESVEIATHTDIEDDGQTVKLTPPTPDVPQTGDSSYLGFWIGLAAVALGGVVSTVIIGLKRKSEDDED